MVHGPNDLNEAVWRASRYDIAASDSRWATSKFAKSLSWAQILSPGVTLHIHWGMVFTTLVAGRTEIFSFVKQNSFTLPLLNLGGAMCVLLWASEKSAAELRASSAHWSTLRLGESVAKGLDGSLGINWASIRGASLFSSGVLTLKIGRVCLRPTRRLSPPFGLGAGCVNAAPIVGARPHPGLGAHARTLRSLNQPGPNPWRLVIEETWGPRGGLATSRPVGPAL